jgi:hypothetical protein
LPAAFQLFPPLAFIAFIAFIAYGRSVRQEESVSTPARGISARGDCCRPSETGTEGYPSQIPPVLLAFHFLSACVLQVVRDQLKASKKHAELREHEMTELVKKHLAEGNRQRARELLVCAKNFRAQIVTCEGKLTNIERVIESIQDAQSMKQQLDALKSGAAQLKVQAGDVFTACRFFCASARCPPPSD